MSFRAVAAVVFVLPCPALPCPDVAADHCLRSATSLQVDGTVPPAIVLSFHPRSQPHPPHACLPPAHPSCSLPPSLATSLLPPSSLLPSHPSSLHHPSRIDSYLIACACMCAYPLACMYVCTCVRACVRVCVCVDASLWDELFNLRMEELGEE